MNRVSCNLSFGLAANVKLLKAEGEVAGELEAENPRHAVTSRLQHIAVLSKPLLNGYVRLLHLYATQSISHAYLIWWYDLISTMCSNKKREREREF